MKYQLFDIPYTKTDMEFQISTTGVMKLKAARFKTRHNKVSDVVQQPATGFKKTSDYKKEYPQEFKQKKQSKRIKEARRINQASKKRKTEYSVDKSEIKKRIQCYVNQMKDEKMLYFWTISFPPGTNDDTAHLLWNKWLTRLRKEKMLKSYLWITERQKNKTIHFHMCINKRMCVKKANRFMRASIMTCIDQRLINYTREQAKNYNGVDIAKDKKTKRVVNFAKKKSEKALTAYLTKYVTKNDEKFSHLAWHSSREYSNLITSVRLTSAEFDKFRIAEFINDDNPLYHEYFTFYRWNGGPPKFLINYLNQLNNTIQSLLN